MASRNSGVKNTTDRDLIICHCLKHDERVHAKSLKMTVVSKPVSLGKKDRVIVNLKTF
jgi:hypothetical protein